MAETETTVIMLTMCLYHILKNHRVYAVLQKELESELRNNDNSPSGHGEPVSSVIPHDAETALSRRMHQRDIPHPPRQFC